MDHWKIKLKWKKLEQAYGEELPRSARNRIGAIISSFRWQDNLETSAPRLKDATATMDHLRGMLINTALWLNARKTPGEKHAVAVLDQVISGKRMAAFHAILALATACNVSKSQLSERSATSGYQEGGAWKTMICQLLIVARESDLPDGIAKPTGAEKNGHQPSPFVRFVEALQLQIPKPHWGFPPNQGALATAISDVKRAARAKEPIAPKT